MKLLNHIKQHLSSDREQAKADTFRAIIADGDALVELDVDCELWLNLEMQPLADILSKIAKLRTGGSAAHSFEVSRQRQIGFEPIENLWFDAVNDYIENEYSEIDFAALSREESMPEPERV